MQHPPHPPWFFTAVEYPAATQSTVVAPTRGACVLETLTVSTVPAVGGPTLGVDMRYIALNSEKLIPENWFAESLHCD
jgi:hypothetical protein